MTSIASLRRPALSRDVPLSQGRLVTVRALSSAQTLAILAAYPDPFPPQRPDPKGPQFAWKPDEYDAGYLTQRGTVRTKRTIAEAAVAIGLDLAEEGFPADCFVPGEKADEVAKCKAWIDRAAPVMNALFGEQELLTLWGTATELGGPEAVLAYIGSLVIEMPRPDAAASGDGAGSAKRVLPENYRYTEDALLLCVAERFGQDPATWPKTLSVEQRLEYLAFERVKLEEADRDRRATARLSALLEAALMAVKR